ncbi:MAG TPA: hypothetical protein VIA07_11555, partial [Desulfuromonadales bacterium]
MEKRICLVVFFLVFCGLGFSPATRTTWAQEGGAKATLVDADCVKCHDREPAEIAAKGMAHKTEITCQACH